MAKEYSLYEAKTRLSALVRQVREGRSVVITVHGKPVAELRPIEARAEQQSFAERVAELTDRGEVLPPRAPSAAIAVGKTRRRGALRRFLDNRD